MLTRTFTIRSLRLAAMVACSTLAVLAQEETSAGEDLPALSLQRLTVGVRSSFFYAPWKDLNDSFGAVRDAYAYHSILGLQSGSIDRHRGDLTAEVDLTYCLVGPISLVVEGFRTFSDARMAVQAMPGGSYQTNYSPIPKAFDNTFDLQVTGIGGGLQIDVLGSLRTRLRLSVGRSNAKLDYAYAFINDYDVYRFNASLRDHSTYIALGLEGSIPVAGPLSVTIGAMYRSVRFSRLEGDGTMFHDYPGSPGYSNTIAFRARLVKAGSYYGIDPAGDWQLDNGRYALVAPWVTTPGTPVHAIETYAVPATLYLSGFGVRGGLTYVL